MESDLRPADLYDLYPTILDSAGIDGRVPLFGESLLQEPGGARTRYYHFYDKDRQAIVDGTLKRYVFEQGQIAFDREITIER